MEITPRFYKAGLLIKNAYKFFENNKKEFGDFYKYRGLFTFYVSHDINQVKHIMNATNKDYGKKSIAALSLHHVLGDSILFSDQEIWKPRRRLMSSSFTKKSSLSMVSLVKVKIDELIEKFEDELKHNSEKEIDVSPVFTQLVLNIIGTAFFNKSFDDDFTEIQKLMEDVQDYLENPPLPFLSNPKVPIPQNIKLKKTKKSLLSFVRRFIEERETSTLSDDTLLDKIMKSIEEDSQSSMSYDDLVIEMLTLIFAGHETTANTLCYILDFLTNNLDKYEKLQKEIDSIYKNEEDPKTTTILGLEYLECVIKESMRLRPAAWALSRVVNHDTELDGVKLKKNDNIIFFPLFMHKDERYWPQPNDFIPERFSPDNLQNLNLDAYLPFGAGPRVCIGAHLAMIELKLILAMLLSKFQFSKCENFTPEIMYTATIYSKNGYLFKIKKRK